MDSQERDFENSLEMARALLGNSEDSSDLWEANELVNRGLALRPFDPDAWVLKCQIMSALGDDVAALASIEMALRRAPRMAEAHYWHTAVLTDLERYDEALRAIARAFRSLGTDDEWLVEDLYYEKAVVLDAVGRHDAALATLEAGLERYPESPILKAGMEPLRRHKLRASFTILQGGKQPKGSQLPATRENPE